MRLKNILILAAAVIAVILIIANFFDIVELIIRAIEWATAAF